MSKLLGTVFSVSKNFKSAKSVDVGDFTTKEEAIDAMLAHYKSNPKRGNFKYTINQCELEEVGGTVFRKYTICFGSNNARYYGSFDKSILAEMAR